MQLDAKDSTAGRLGALLAKTTDPPYGISAEYPPENFSGLWVTYRRGAFIRDAKEFKSIGNIVWTFTVWNQQAFGFDKVIERLFQLLENKELKTATSSASNFYLANRSEPLFDDTRNSYYVRAEFDSTALIALR